MLRQVLIGGAALALSGCIVIHEGDTDNFPSPPSTPAPAATEARVPTDVRRVTIVVEDIERSLKLYRDALGMKINYDAPLSVSGPAFAHGQPGRKVRLVLLQANDPWIGWIGLLQYTDPPLPRRAPPPQALEIGAHVIVTAVQDAATACAAAARAPGVRMTVQPSVSEYPGRNGGAPIRVLGCQLWDGDGAYLELNQALR